MLIYYHYILLSFYWC